MFCSYQLEDIAPAGMAIDVYDESRLQVRPNFIFSRSTNDIAQVQADIQEEEAAAAAELASARAKAKDLEQQVCKKWRL